MTENFCMDKQDANCEPQNNMSDLCEENNKVEQRMEEPVHTAETDEIPACTGNSESLDNTKTGNNDPDAPVGDEQPLSEQCLETGTVEDEQSKADTTTDHTDQSNTQQAPEPTATDPTQSPVSVPTPGKKGKITVKERKDVRHVTIRDRKREVPYNSYSTVNRHIMTGLSEAKLIVETDAVRALVEYFQWGSITAENTVERAAILYGRLCECTSSLYGKYRWAEVCGIIPLHSEQATQTSIRIEAEEWIRASDALEIINREAESNGQETFVMVGWAHSHPMLLEPFFSQLDLTLQKTIMNSDDLYGLVINPHRQIMACYKDSDSKPCKAVFLLNDELLKHWSFHEHHLDLADNRTFKEVHHSNERVIRMVPKKNKEPLPMQTQRPVNQQYCTDYQQQRTTYQQQMQFNYRQPQQTPVMQMQHWETNNQPVPAWHAFVHYYDSPQADWLNNLNFRQVSEIVNVIKMLKNPNDTVALVSMVRNEEIHDLQLMALYQIKVLPAVQEQLAYEWKDYYYLVKLSNGHSEEMTEYIRMLAGKWSLPRKISNRTRRVSLMLINENAREIHMLCEPR